MPFMGEENELNLRNQTEYRNPLTRLQLFANSFSLLLNHGIN